MWHYNTTTGIIQYSKTTSAFADNTTSTAQTTTFTSHTQYNINFSK